MDRGFMQISFAWLFAIIAGAIILFLAIFMATKILHSGQYQTSAEAQSQINTLLDPLQTGVQTGEVTTLQLSSETRIYNTCQNSQGSFGYQTISLSQQSFNKWSEPTNGLSVQNKYIFSENVTQGKEFMLFTKPFDFPFKVADLIYMTSSSTNYCFVNSPSGIETELSNLNQGNIILENETDKCPKKSIQVCFSGNSVDCGSSDITVDYGSGTVNKNGTSMTFSGDALMYAAIFSNKTIYDCEVGRLMNRAYELSKIYSDKLSTISQAGCSQSMASDLLQMASTMNSFSTPEDSFNSNLLNEVNQVQNDNEGAQCRLW